MNILKFTIIITTKNRKSDLLLTLSKIKFLLDHDDVACIICDDGSNDGTFEEIKSNFPSIELIQNATSKGLIFSRNRLMNMVQTEFAISIDDDLHFLSEDPLQKVSSFFDDHPQAAILGFRIFWGLEEPLSTETSEKPQRVKSFAGGAHIWRMQAWRDVPDYPSWFVFYGEEDFQSYQLFKKNWEIYYLPSVLVNHRVELKNRKKKYRLCFAPKKVFAFGMVSLHAFLSVIFDS
jgi:GT2 family glycosyltransferase